MTLRVLPNPLAEPVLSVPDSGADPLPFHRRLPGYTPTPLVDAAGIARRLGVARLWVKDESTRLGLPAFKIVGASWAVYRALAERLGGDVGEWSTLEELRERVAPLRPLTLATATDGNHGRAVARMARLLGLDARIFVPAEMAEARQSAIRSEGAEVVVVDGTYDDAVALAAQQAGPRCLVIADTALAEGEVVPQWVIEGYGTILREVDEALAAQGEAGPTLVAVQIGVGALAAAVTRHYHRPGARDASRGRPRLLGVEPLGAACMFAAIEAGRPVMVPGPHHSIMSGLVAGMASPVAWPVVSRGIDLFVAIDDEWSRQAMRLLAAEGIVAGETGAAGLAGLLALTESENQADARARLRLDPNARVLVFNTEGATDPDAYHRIVGTSTRP